MKSVVISSMVWPEPESSAAGVRTEQLLDFFLSQGAKVAVHSGAKSSEFSARLESRGIKTFSCEANDSRFDAWISAINPEIVLFGSFIVEEQFGWRVRQSSPDSLRVIDNHDFHALRRYRESLVKVKKNVAEFEWGAFCSQEDTLRELASYLRSDLTLVLSKFEYQLLVKDLKFPVEKVFYLPIFYSPIESSSFECRADFAFLGNQRHPPNEDAIRYLLNEIWPALSAQLPRARLKIAGAYPLKSLEERARGAKNVDWSGPVANAQEFFANVRVSLAPLRFGAGLKGKILDSLAAGTPVITTETGIEGIDGLMGARDLKEFVHQAVTLYSDEGLWSQRQKEGFHILQEDFKKSDWLPQLVARLETILTERDMRRQCDWTGQLLWREGFRSTEYFSRWIEVKNSTTKEKS